MIFKNVALASLSPLRSTTVVGTLTMLCSSRHQSNKIQLQRRHLFRTSAARCHSVKASSTTSTFPLLPNSGPPGPEVSKLFNTTQPDVVLDLEGATSEDLLPAEIDLRNTCQWKVTVYQFESCPFCRKVRACLDYLGVPYSVRSQVMGRNFILCLNTYSV